MVQRTFVVLMLNVRMAIILLLAHPGLVGGHGPDKITLRVAATQPSVLSPDPLSLTRPRRRNVAILPQR